MNDELTKTQEAAAFHGLATNTALPLTDRLGSAWQALDLYEAGTEELLAEVASLRQQLDEARGELEHWRSGRRRKGMPVVESVPDGLHYATWTEAKPGDTPGELVPGEGEVPQPIRASHPAEAPDGERP